MHNAVAGGKLPQFREAIHETQTSPTNTQMSKPPYCADFRELRRCSAVKAPQFGVIKHYNRGNFAQSYATARKVPSGMRLKFGGAISGNMRPSFQAARSIG